MRALRLAVVSLLLACAVAHAQQWPFSFDPNIAQKPAAINAELANWASWPVMPVSTMQDHQAGPVTLTYFDEVLELLDGIRNRGPNAMTWPDTPVMCAGHAAFTIPTLLPAGASSTCRTADMQIRQALADLGACRDVEEPERYVLSTPAAVVNDSTTTSLEALIGLAGEALSHAGAPPQNVLPPQWVPTMRRIVDKIRHPTLIARLGAARTSYVMAQNLGTTNASCFNATALATLQSELTALIAEIDAAKAYLNQLKVDGEAEVANEIIRLGAHSRARRNDLTFTSLTQAEKEFIGVWLGGIYWRMRGGGLIPDSGVLGGRVNFVLHPWQVMGQMAGGQDGYDAAFPIYVAATQGWSVWHDMGTTPGQDDKYYDLVFMTERGMRQINYSLASAVAPLDAKQYDTVPLWVGGLQMGPCYYYGWEYFWSAGISYANLPSPYTTTFGNSGANYGELCSGAALGLGFVRTLLNGVPTGLPPTCTIDCSDKVCGDDGCAGSCGTCGDGTSCYGGQCLSEPPDGADGGTGNPGASDDPGSNVGCGCGTSAPPWSAGLALLVWLGMLTGRRRSRACGRR